MILSAFLFFNSNNLFADPPDPPPPHGDKGGPVGGGAPIGPGLYILIALAGSYGIRKYYVKRKKCLLD